MDAPALAISVEPMEGGKVAYLPLAAAQSGQGGHARVILRLRIKNNTGKKVTVTGIRFSFPSSIHGAIDMEGIPFAMLPDDSEERSADIPAGKSATWSNGRVDVAPGDAEDWRENMVNLTGTPPTRIRVSVFCTGYDDPAVVNHTLVAYTSPTPQGAFLLPFAAGDLRDGEFVVTQGWHWANGGAWGTQIFAHDISVRGVNGGYWSQLLPGKQRAYNDSYRIWGLPVRAMADGEVESCHDAMADNTVLDEFPEPTPSPGAGNHFWIKHGDVFVKYAHLQYGSMPDALKQKGTKVSAGQFLGRIGNSGNSTNPHTHIECVKGSKSGPLRGLPFRDAWVVEHAAFKPPTASSPWVRLTAHGIPREESSIWPASTTPGCKIPAAGIARGGTWANSYWISTSRSAFEAKAQELFDEQKRRIIWASTYVENGKRRWVGIARAGDWANSFWISAGRVAFEKKAQQLFDEHGRRLVHVYSYLQGSTLYFMGIARAGTWASSYWVSASRADFEKHAQRLFDEQGRRLTFVHTFMEGSKRLWAGIAQGGTWANNFWVSEGLDAFNQKAQALFDEHGRRLVHVHTYVSGSKRYWVGIARAGDWANSFWYSRDLDSFNRETQDLFEDQGRRLMVAEFLDT